MNFYRIVQTIFVLALWLFVSAPSGRAYAYSFNVLYKFQGGSDGISPVYRFLMDEAGNLYGVTYNGGGGTCPIGCGTAYKLAPNGQETVFHVFHKRSGDFTSSGLIQDKRGNFYGTTASGGDDGGGCDRTGCGVVFRLKPDGTYKALHRFSGTDGYSPTGLVRDKAGNLYGETFYGGDLNCESPYGCGLVFKVAPDGTETTFYEFHGGSDGANPSGGPMIKDKDGNFFGTTNTGGDNGYGTVFELTPDGKETVLYAFSGASDGANPVAPLAKDDAANLYGATSGGGANGAGVVFELTQGGVETVLHSFANDTDGEEPNGLLLDSAGNIYGTTIVGGGTGCGGRGCGVVYALAPDGTESILHTFTGGSDGGEPRAVLIADKAGNLYGAAVLGGNSSCDNGQGCGIVFELTP